MRARIAEAAVSAGSAESCSRLRIWAFCAVSICLSRAARAAALSVAVGGRLRVGGGQLSGEQLSPAGAEHVLGEEQPDDLVQPLLRGLDGAGVVRVVGGVLGPGRVVLALVVHQRDRAAAVGQPADPAPAVPAPDPAR
jgi:hypothetical protein